MAILASSGHFITTAGPDFVPLLHDVDLLILFNSYSAADAIVRGGRGSVGFAMNGDAASVSQWSDDASSPANFGRMLSRSAVRTVSGLGTTILQGNVTNWTKGFELTWSVPSPGVAMGYAAIGGLDNVSFHNVTNQQTVYTPGFEMNGLFSLTRTDGAAYDVATSQHCLGMGCASSPTQRGAFSTTGEQGASPTNNNRRQRLIYTHMGQWMASGNLSRFTDLQSITPTQFILDPWNNTSGSYDFPTAVFRGDHSWVGVTTQPTGAPPQNVTLPDPGFDPAMWIFMSFGTNASTGLRGWATHMIGAATELGQCSSSHIDASNRNPSESTSLTKTDACIAFTNVEEELATLAHISDWDNRTLTYTATTTTAREIIAWALGDRSNQPQPRVGVNPPWTVPAATPANGPF